jgi:hypothetical protein
MAPHLPREHLRTNAVPVVVMQSPYLPRRVVPGDVLDNERPDGVGRVSAAPPTT